MALASSRSRDPHLSPSEPRLSGPFEVPLTSVEGGCGEADRQFFYHALERAMISPENAEQVEACPRSEHGDAHLAGMDALPIGPDDRAGHRHMTALFNDRTTLSEHLT